MRGVTKTWGFSENPEALHCMVLFRTSSVRLPHLHKNESCNGTVIIWMMGLLESDSLAKKEERTRGIRNFVLMAKSASGKLWYIDISSL